METLANKKVYVGKFSKEIQEKAFKLGWGWKSYKKEVDFLNSPFLFFTNIYSILCSNCVSDFNDHPYEEVTAEWILNLPETPKNLLEKEFIRNFHLSRRGEIIKDFQYFSSEQKWFRQFNSKEEANAYKHLPELLYWRDKYNEGWKPDWEDKKRKFIIDFEQNRVSKGNAYEYSRILTFKTPEIRDNFLEEFKDLIEICKPLL